jgi:cellulose synthase/poly-beta-1,6-N-acetylglucosamine synthase-like glycosyltransferase
MIFLLKLWLILIEIVIFIFGSYTLLYYIYSKKREKKKLKNKFFPSVTLVIPFYNEEIIMKKKIEDTAKIRYQKDKLEIIFLNDHSTDNSVKLIKENTKRFPFKFKVVNNPGKQGKSNALNYILPHIKSEITVITDADSLIKEDAIEKLSKEFINEEVGGANARLIVLEPKESKSSYREENLYRKFYDIWRRGESNIHSISVCNGPLMAFRTDLIKNVRLDSCVDDTELIFEVIKKNFRVVYNTEAMVYEVSPLKYTERVKQKMRRVRGLMDVYISNLKLIGKNKFGNVILPYALLTHVISPYIVLFGSLIYFILLFIVPYFFLTLLLFIIPKAGYFVSSFVSTQIIMAISPFFAKGWNTAKSSREELRR